MTKYILHGGVTRTESESNSNFFKEIVVGAPLQATVLGVYFACPEDTWPERFGFFKTRLMAESGRDDLNIHLASSDVAVFKEQVMQAHVIYLHGGSTELLSATLSKVENFAEFLRDKVVVGSSAGVYVLSKYYYSNDRDGIFEGLGALSIKTFCHYDETKAAKLELLKKHQEDLPVYAIPEEKFFVIEK